MSKDIVEFINTTFPDYSYSSRTDMVNAISKWNRYVSDQILNKNNVNDQDTLLDCNETLEGLKSALEDKHIKVSEMQGVVAIFVCKSGNIIETEACFDDVPFGGFSKKDSQRIRAKNRIVKKVVNAYCGSNLTDNISQYTIEKIFDDLIKNGSTICYEFIGYNEEKE